MARFSPGLAEARIEAAALTVNPWSDGKGDDDYRVLSNRIVVSQKKHRCAICMGVIRRRERVRAQAECSDGIAKTFRFCSVCVGAMGFYSLRDNIRPLMSRFDVGRKRAERLRKVS